MRQNKYHSAVFPADWESNNVEKLFFVKGRIGWRGLRKEHFTEEGPYLITGMHIRDSWVKWDECFHIPESKYQESPEIMVSIGDLIITKDGTIGKVAYIDWLPGPTSLNSHLFLVRPKSNNVENCFAKHVFSSWLFHKYIETQRTGSTLSGLSESRFLKFPFPTPLVAEQHRIAEILDTIDEAIQKTETLIAKLKAMKQGLLHDLLTRGIDEDGKQRDPNAHPEQFQDSFFGRVPNSWEIKRIGEITLSAIDGPFGSNIKTEHYVNEPGVRVVRLQNIGQGSFIDGDKVYISSTYADLLKRYEVLGGDLIIASLGDNNNPIARACLYPKNSSPGIVKADCFRFRFFNTKANAEYVMYALNCPTTRKDIPGIAQGVTRDRVNLTTIKKVRIPVPPIGEQEKICEILGANDERIQKEEQNMSKIKLQKKGLMHDLLTGKVRVNE